MLVSRIIEMSLKQLGVLAAGESVQGNELADALITLEGLLSQWASGKVATIGTGTTVYPNGQRVKITDPAITKKQAAEYLQFHMNKDAKIFNKSLIGIPLSQNEYDLYMDFTYQFGTGAWSQSSMLRNLKTRNYVQACKSLLKWKYVAKKDCSIRKNNCYGVWTRQQARYEKCMGEN